MISNGPYTKPLCMNKHLFNGSFEENLSFITILNFNEATADRVAVASV